MYHNVKDVKETANLTKRANGRFSQKYVISNRLITSQSNFFSHKDVDWYARLLWSCQDSMGS